MDDRQSLKKRLEMIHQQKINVSRSKTVCRSPRKTVGRSKFPSHTNVTEKQMFWIKLTALATLSRALSQSPTPFSVR